MRPARSIGSLAAILLAVFVVVVAPAFASVSASHASEKASISPVAVAASPVSQSPSSPLLERATSSLAQGAGPAYGHSWKCTNPSDGAFTCSGGAFSPATVHPDAPASPRSLSGVRPAVSGNPA